MLDPRNIHAKCLAVEHEIAFTLPPHSLDPTGSPIYVTGHIDQIRDENGQAKVDDYKTGQKTGWEMIHDYAGQMAAYTYGAKLCGFPTAVPGRIIRARGYRTRKKDSTSPDGVFFNAPFRSEGVLGVLETVQIEVAIVRMGHVRFSTGPHCTYCEFGGYTGCQPQWNKLIQLGKV